MLWTTVWFLLVLKLPVAYLAWVIWWAVKDPPEPRPGEPARVREPLGGPPLRPGMRDRLLPRPRHPAPHGSPLRHGRSRPAPARAHERITT
jgi:hypothetical protein